MIDFTRKARYGFEDLVRIIQILRRPGGCPWDQAQTHDSIRRNFLEETYEVLEALDEHSPEHLCEELGDVLTQVIFHSDMEADAGRFTLDDVCNGAAQKMVRRHPHIFGDATVKDADEVLVNWEEIKREEKGQETFTDTLEAVAKTLPGTWRAEKLQKKAARAGFAWPDTASAVGKLAEETKELQDAEEGTDAFAEELGDVLFAAVSVARCAGKDPEALLHAACDKFTSRFSRMEEAALAEGRNLDTLSRDELLQLWERAKTPRDC